MRLYARVFEYATTVVRLSTIHIREYTTGIRTQFARNLTTTSARPQHFLMPPCYRFPKVTLQTRPYSNKVEELLSRIGFNKIPPPKREALQAKIRELTSRLYLTDSVLAKLPKSENTRLTGMKETFKNLLCDSDFVGQLTSENQNLILEYAALTGSTRVSRASFYVQQMSMDVLGMSIARQHMV